MLTGPWQFSLFPYLLSAIDSTIICAGYIRSPENHFRRLTTVITPCWYGSSSHALPACMKRLYTAFILSRARRSGRPRCEAWNLSWMVRYRTFLWFFSQMSKLYRARSRLYRRRFLQVNTRWKALDEIYKIYMLLHRSDLNISEKKSSIFFAFLGKILQK